MSLKAKAFLLFLAGALGGALAWTAVGWTGWLNWTVELPGVAATAKQLAIRRSEIGLVSMGIIGFLLGVADCFSFDRFADRARVVLVTTLAGCAVGAVVLQIGVPIAPTIGMGLDTPLQTPGESVALASAQATAAQGIVWAIPGMVFGLVFGLVRKAPLLMRQGAFAGLIGGLASGFLARMAPPIPIGPLPTMISLPVFVLGGALIGLAIGVVTYLFRMGSLTVVKGSNAGKEYLICAPVTVIGSGAGCDIVLTGDATILTRHCSIEEDGDHLMLRILTDSSGGAASLLLDGAPVSGLVKLKASDEMRIGRYLLRFLSRDPAPAHSEAETVRTPFGQEQRVQEARESEPVDEEKPEPETEITTPVEVVLKKERGESRSRTIEKTDRIPADAPEAVGLYRREEGARLVAIAGPYQGGVYPLGDAKRTTIGRGSDCTVALVDDPAASREHAVILLANGVHVIRDEESANGTLLNNLPLTPHTPHRLAPKDTISIGRTVLRYEA